jgi:predicted nucleic acid-binding protein
LALAQLRALLRTHRRVALDTCIFIYQWEANPRYSPLTDYIFSALEQSDLVAVTSTITLTELLVHPYRNQDTIRANELLGMVSTFPHLEWISPDLEIADRAAEVRAQYRLQTPAAMQAATAIHSRATALITNDPIFARVPEFETMVLDQIL